MTDARERLLTVWDAADDPPRDAGSVWRWNGYVENGAARSLLQYVEDNAPRLRAKYLAWVHDFAEFDVNGRSVREWLTFEDGVSYWWMMLLAEKSAYKCPIADAVRLLALEEVVLATRPTMVRVDTANRALAQSVEHLCRAYGIPFQCKRRSRSRSWLGMRRAYNALPLPLQGALSFARQVRQYGRLRTTGAPTWSGDPSSVLVCSYFDNVDAAAAGKGQFRSYYWDGLPELMRRFSRRANWLHLYVVRTAEVHPQSTSWPSAFNRSRDQGTHRFLESFFTWRIAGRAMIRWLRVLARSRKLAGLEVAFTPRESRVSFWWVLGDDWRQSLRGPVAVKNAFWIELFDRALGDAPHQSCGLYLCESQAWERAFIRAWRKHGHGTLHGVVHSTLNFWDLRHFWDARTWASAPANGLQLPDRVVVNGEAASRVYGDSGSPMRLKLECEALRYTYLTCLRSRRNHTFGGKSKILILGDASPRFTHGLLHLLEQLEPNLRQRYELIFKSHPDLPISPEDHPSLSLIMTSAPLGELLGDITLAFAGAATSAAVDAYLAGVPVAVLRDDEGLNLSPLRNQRDVTMVSTLTDLERALDGADRTIPTDAMNLGTPSSFFRLDEALPCWTRLIAGEQVA